jgi:hypothetical protein
MEGRQAREHAVPPLLAAGDEKEPPAVSGHKGLAQDGTRLVPAARRYHGRAGKAARIVQEKGKRARQYGQAVEYTVFFFDAAEAGALAGRYDDRTERHRLLALEAGADKLAYLVLGFSQGEGYLILQEVEGRIVELALQDGQFLYLRTMVQGPHDAGYVHDRAFF